MIPGWPLSHYGLTEKAVIFLENFESKFDDEEEGEIVIIDWFTYPMT